MAGRWGDRLPAARPRGAPRRSGVARLRGRARARAARRSLASLPALPAASSEDEPDLRITLPSVTYADQVAPVYVDRYERPGQVLYRFDAHDPQHGRRAGPVRRRRRGRQALWAGRRAVGARRRRAARAAAELRAPQADGARLELRRRGDARALPLLLGRALRAPRAGGARRGCRARSASACSTRSTLPDGVSKWFPGRPRAAVVPLLRAGRRGSCGWGSRAGAADRYSSQREFQYVDVTGPGAGDLHAARRRPTPTGHVHEADRVRRRARRSSGRSRAWSPSGTASFAVAGGATAARSTLPARAMATDDPGRAGGLVHARADVDVCYAADHGGDGARSTRSPRLRRTGRYGRRRPRDLRAGRRVRGDRRVHLRRPATPAGCVSKPADGPVDGPRRWRHRPRHRGRPGEAAAAAPRVVGKRSGRTLAPMRSAASGRSARAGRRRARVGCARDARARSPRSPGAARAASGSPASTAAPPADGRGHRHGPRRARRPACPRRRAPDAIARDTAGQGSMGTRAAGGPDRVARRR